MTKANTTKLKAAIEQTMENYFRKGVEHNQHQMRQILGIHQTYLGDPNA